MQRLREPGLRVECGRNLFLDRCEEPFGGRAVQDRVEQHIGGEQVVSQNASVVAGHIVALRMQHAVHRDEAQELLRLAGNEDQIEGQPVTGESGDKAEPGHDPWVVKQAPGDHLHQADRETEVDSAAADELHRRPTHALHQVVELGLVVHQGGDCEILQIDEPRQVGLHFRKQVVDDSRGGRVHPRQHSLTTGFRDRVPQPGAHLFGEVASHLVDGSGERLAEFLDGLLGVDLVQDLLGSQQLVGEHLDRSSPRSCRRGAEPHPANRTARCPRTRSAGKASAAQRVSLCSRRKRQSAASTNR